MTMISYAKNLRPGDHVRVEQTTTFNDERRVKVHAGTAHLDQEGVLRVDGVPLCTDPEGYLPRGVVLLSARRED